MKTQNTYTKEQYDEKLMVLFYNWSMKPTKSYQGFIASDPENTREKYLGHEFSKAGIPVDVGWNFVQLKMGTYYDPNTTYLYDHYSEGYNLSQYDEKYRNYCIDHYIN